MSPLRESHAKFRDIITYNIKITFNMVKAGTFNFHVIFGPNLVAKQSNFKLLHCRP